MGKATEHLSTTERENIARGLFSVKSVKGGELIGLCPVHKDKNPSFSYNPSKDVCHCFTCGFSGDLIKLYGRVKGCGNNKIGFMAFCKEFNISDGIPLSPLGNLSAKKRQKQMPPLDGIYKKLEPLPDTWIKKLLKTRGWSSGALDFLGIKMQTLYQKKDTGEIKQLLKPDRIAIPICDKDRHVRNIRLYKPGKVRL